VLTFSREPRSNMKYQEVNKVIEESIQAFADLCNEQSVHLEKKLDASLPPVLIDKDQVREALNNFISNAIGAMPDGGTLTIKTIMEELNDVHYVTVEVSDTGPGVPENELDVIFEPFYTTKDVGIGTGLGLTICKKIVDEQNGLLTVVSTLGKGTSFTIYFPHVNKEEEDMIKCWEFNKCGVEKTEGAAEMICPSYPNYGRICWAVAGTFCGKKVSGAIARKLGDCRKCTFYQRVVVQKDI
ncbi:MAG: sensor histidine kinase, partial [Thermodesulfovibrionia bacterium]|nr:sensor histidine kinase [Thermodesulfovibrionia bacterium]